jgi:hypothetical protein
MLQDWSFLRVPHIHIISCDAGIFASVRQPSSSAILLLPLNNFISRSLLFGALNALNSQNPQLPRSLASRMKNRKA